MDLRPGDAAGALSASAVRDAVRQWVDEQWDPERSLVDWRSLLADSGWAVPSWPSAWHGKGWPAWTDATAASAIVAAGAVGLPPGVATALAGPTILAHGSDAQRARFLRPILTGEETWCQLFSEPAAGSDLAGLITHAELDGDEWIVNGQKVWNTSAHHADLGILVARTNWDVPKHRHHLLRPADAAAGRRGTPVAPDEQPQLVQRSVPRRRSRPGGLGHR